MDEIIKKSVDNLINQILKVREDEVVLIDAEIYNRDNNNDFAELSLLEEIAFSIRKNFAIPVIEITTEKLTSRIFGEPSIDKNKNMLHYQNKRFSLFDKMIEIGISPRYCNTRNVPRRLKNDVKHTSEEIFKLAIASMKQLVLIDYPQKSIAESFNFEYEDFRKLIFTALSVDVKNLKDKIEKLSEKISDHGKYCISTGESRLEITPPWLNKRVFNGEFLSDSIIYLPTGKIEIMLNSVHLNGSFKADSLFFDNLHGENILVEFEEGRIKKISTENRNEAFYRLLDSLIDCKDNVTLILGANPFSQILTHYPSLDEIVENSISLRLTTNNDNTILLTSINANITSCADYLSDVHADDKC
ncbi:MAG: hypothetical protein PHR06_05785 [Candidatus Cloacimonetes bacterium]|nr:hypothetical protein [Candidatus Cloacimonadota bacterium]